MQVVSARRGAKLPSSAAQLEQVFSGRVWAGRQAAKLGLVDGIGDMRTILQAKFGKEVRSRCIYFLKAIIAIARTHIAEADVPRRLLTLAWCTAAGLLLACWLAGWPYDVQVVMSLVNPMPRRPFFLPPGFSASALADAHRSMVQRGLASTMAAAEAADGQQGPTSLLASGNEGLGGYLASRIAVEAALDVLSERAAWDKYASIRLE